VSRAQRTYVNAAYTAAAAAAKVVMVSLYGSALRPRARQLSSRVPALRQAFACIQCIFF
jgi:hypothetical protein